MPKTGCIAGITFKLFSYESVWQNFHVLRWWTGDSDASFELLLIIAIKDYAGFLTAADADFSGYILSFYLEILNS